MREVRQVEVRLTREFDYRGFSAEDSLKGAVAEHRLRLAEKANAKHNECDSQLRVVTLIAWRLKTSRERDTGVSVCLR